MGRPPLKNKTTREQTRQPSTYKSEIQLRMEANGLTWDENKHYVTVEDYSGMGELATGAMISRVDVDGFKGRGYEVVSDNPAVTGHRRIVLMAVDKARYEELYAPKHTGIQGAEIDMITTQSAMEALRGLEPEIDAMRRANAVQMDDRTFYQSKLEQEANDD